MMHIAKKTGSAALLVAALATPTAVALNQLAGNGQWKDSATGQIVRERSKVVVLLYPMEQQSVLRTDSTEQVSF